MLPAHRLVLVWSPGSTTASSSPSPSRAKKAQPATTACATQTTPTKSEASALPRGFRPVRLNSLPLPATNLPLGASASNLDGPLSPSTMSEASVATGGAAQRRPSGLGSSPPASPGALKYWTLPRHISVGSKADRDSDSDHRRRGELTAIKQIETDEPPPPNARFLYETETAKYFTVPVSTLERTKSTVSVPAAKKYDGIGPVNESGVPLALRTVSKLCPVKFDHLDSDATRQFRFDDPE